MLRRVYKRGRLTKQCHERAVIRRRSLHEALEERLPLTIPFASDLPVSLVEVQKPVSGALADLDGDQDLDVLSISKQDGELAWYENLDGAGTFGRKIHLYQVADPSFVRATDFDADGDQDILWMGRFAADDPRVDRLLWLENDGSSQFVTLHSSPPLQSEEFEIVDLDSDGDPDVLGSGGVWIERNEQDELVVHDLAVQGFEILSSRAADMDGDGDMDILSAATNDAGFQLLWHENGPESFALYSATAIDHQMSDVVGIDVDADGDLDPVYMSYTATTGGVWWLENVGDPAIGPAQPLSESGGQGRMEVADVDGDSHDDLVIASYLTDRVRDQVVWLKGSDQGGLTRTTVVSNHVLLPGDITTGDIDGDRDLDILASGLGSNQLAWIENHDAGSRWQRHAATDAGAGGIGGSSICRC